MSFIQNHLRWAARNFWPMVSKGTPGYVQATPYRQGQTVPTAGAASSIPGTVSMVPHRVTQYRRPAFWQPAQNYKRQEYLVSPPYLPGTAILFTLFHPTFIPGLQGYADVLPWNFAWAWGRNNFEKFGSLAYLAQHPVTGVGRQQNAWNPAMRVPQGPGTGKVWQQPRPFYIPPIINPSTGGSK